jgi:hypothetical protein
MKIEPKSRSGLKVAGVIALLASLLFFAPVVSAASYSVILIGVADPSVASIGEEVDFVYTVYNNGDTTLYNVRIEDGVGGIVNVGNLEAGEEQEILHPYTVAENDVQIFGGQRFILVASSCKADNKKGRQVVESWASFGIEIVD